MVEETLTVGDTEVVVRQTADGFEVEEANNYDRSDYSTTIRNKMDDYGCQKIIDLDPMPFELMLDGDGDTWLIDSEGGRVAMDAVHGNYAGTEEIISMAEDLIDALE